MDQSVSSVSIRTSKVVLQIPSTSVNIWEDNVFPLVANEGVTAGSLVNLRHRVLDFAHWSLG